MHRELNPQIFGTRQLQERSTSNSDLQTTNGIPAHAIPKASPASTYLPMEIKALEAQVQSLKLHHNAMEKKFDTLTAQMAEFVKSTTSRFDRFSQAMVRLEQNLGASHQDLDAKYASCAGRLTERRLSEAKIQDMIDRHNEIVRNFENRLLTMQKVVSDQERQLLNSQALLDEARQDLMKLKRL